MRCFGRIRSFFFFGAFFFSSGGFLQAQTEGAACTLYSYLTAGNYELKSGYLLGTKSTTIKWLSPSALIKLAEKMKSKEVATVVYTDAQGNTQYAHGKLSYVNEDGVVGAANKSANLAVFGGGKLTRIRPESVQEITILDFGRMTDGGGLAPVSAPIRYAPFSMPAAQPHNVIESSLNALARAGQDVVLISHSNVLARGKLTSFQEGGVPVYLLNGKRIREFDLKLVLSNKDFINKQLTHWQGEPRKVALVQLSDGRSFEGTYVSNGGPEIVVRVRTAAVASDGKVRPVERDLRIQKEKIADIQERVQRDATMSAPVEEIHYLSTNGREKIAQSLGVGSQELEALPDEALYRTKQVLQELEFLPSKTQDKVKGMLRDAIGRVKQVCGIR